MLILSRAQLLQVIGRAYGPELADALAPQLPKQVDLDQPSDAELLYRLGVTCDRLFNALGAEL